MLLQKPLVSLGARAHGSWVKGETPFYLCPVENENSDLVFIYFWREEVGRGFHLSPFSPSVPTDADAHSDPMLVLQNLMWPPVPVSYLSQ